VADSLREVEKKEIDPKTGEIKILKVQEKVPMYIETWSRFDYAVTGSKRQEAKIVGDDPLTDTALLQVIDPNWKPTAAAPFAPVATEKRWPAADAPPSATPRSLEPASTAVPSPCAKPHVPLSSL